MANNIRPNKIGSRVIALEEHYSDPRFGDLRKIQPATIVDRLLDLDELRLKEMDEGGIHLQVLSHAPPGAQALGASNAVSLARSANDFLHEAVSRHPTRYAAFASLPTIDPNAAADELERTVDKLGFKGAMVHGLTGGIISRRQAFLADTRTRASTRCADLSSSGHAASFGRPGLLFRSARPYACRLGFRHRVRNSSHANDCRRRF